MKSILVFIPFVLVNVCRAVPLGNGTQISTNTNSKTTTTTTTTIASPIITLKQQKSTQLQLVCIVQNLPSDFMLVWWFNGNTLPSQGDNRAEGSQRFTYAPTRSGTYTCQVVDSANNVRVNSTIAVVLNDGSYLTVTTPSVIPTLYVRLNKTIDDDKVFRIECIVKSSPRANVSFTRLGETLIASDENGIELKTRKDGDSVTYIMTLEKITHRQAGEYFCRAQNGVYKKNVVVGVVELAGQECSQDLLDNDEQIQCSNKEKCISKTLCEENTIEKCLLYRCERPDVPIDAEIFRCTHNAVEIKWTRDPKAKQYMINIYPSEGSNYVMGEVGNHFIQNGLDSNRVYEFTVEAHNDFAISKTSPVLKCKTNRMEPPSRVVNPKVNLQNSNVVLTWAVPTDDGMKVDDKTSNTGSLRYHIEYCPQEKESVGQDVKAECERYTTNSTSLSLPKEVKRDSVYKFTVIPINEVGIRGEAHTTYQMIPKSGSTILQIVHSVLFGSLAVVMVLMN